MESILLSRALATSVSAAVSAGGWPAVSSLVRWTSAPGEGAPREGAVLRPPLRRGRALPATAAPSRVAGAPWRVGGGGGRGASAATAAGGGRGEGTGPCTAELRIDMAEGDEAGGGGGGRRVA